MDLHTFDRDLFGSLCKSKGVQNGLNRNLERLIAQSQNLGAGQAIILPHKCCLSILMACCYQINGDTESCTTWLVMTQYLSKKLSESRTSVDDDLSKISEKFLKRRDLRFMVYEVLYFVKEIAKVREDVLTRMNEEINAFLQKFPPFSDFIKSINPKSD